MKTETLPLKFLIKTETELYNSRTTKVGEKNEEDTHRKTKKEKLI